jgi:formate hydrogenlyase subunit 3/multisubunit Na+/H+ antiporter MnhD subunit
MRGISAHSNGFQTCRALHLLQILLGTIDVPGGWRYKAPYPKPCPPGPKPAGKPGQVVPGEPLPGAPLGYRGGVLHILCHGFGKATLFFSVGVIAYMTGTRRISALRGLATSMPLTATAFFVGLLSVTGVPPFGCFWSKFMTLEGAMQLHGAVGPIVLTMVLCETLISFGWMLYVAQKVFLGAAPQPALVKTNTPWPLQATLVALIIGCLAAPVIGIPLVRFMGT